MAAISGTETATRDRDGLENRLGPQATLAAQPRSKELLKQTEGAERGQTQKIKIDLYLLRLTPSLSVPPCIRSCRSVFAAWVGL